MRYNIGDAVKIKGDSKSIFVITDFEDFTKASFDGNAEIDVDYELIQVYPVNKVAQYAVVNHEQIDMHWKEYSSGYNTLIKKIIQDGERIGIYSQPLFMEIVSRNKRDKSKNKATVAKEKKLDIISYKTIETVDKCLDAINDLNILHKEFGDDEYLKAKKAVIQRLKKITKK